MKPFLILLVGEFEWQTCFLKWLRSYLRSSDLQILLKYCCNKTPSIFQSPFAVVVNTSAFQLDGCEFKSWSDGNFFFKHDFFLYITNNLQSLKHMQYTGTPPLKLFFETLKICVSRKPCCQRSDLVLNLQNETVSSFLAIILQQFTNNGRYKAKKQNKSCLKIHNFGGIYRNEFCLLRWKPSIILAKWLFFQNSFK